MKPLEEHLADFLLTHHKGPEWRDYRRRCLEFWREAYGEKIAGSIEARVMAEYGKRAKGRMAT